MNTMNAPPECSLLCCLFVISLLNHMSRDSLKGITPMQAKFGPIPDISKFLHFRWWEPVYYLDLEGVEHRGHWAGIAEHIGDELTWWIVSEETGKISFALDGSLYPIHSSKNMI